MTKPSEATAMAMLTCDFPVWPGRGIGTPPGKAAIIIRCTHAVHFFNFLRALSALHDRAVCSFGQHIFGYASNGAAGQVHGPKGCVRSSYTTKPLPKFICSSNDALGSRDAVSMRA